MVKPLCKGDFIMKAIQHVGIIGRGAIGTLYATLLQQNPYVSVVVIADEQRKEKYETNPLKVNGNIADFKYASNGKPLDMIMICTKIAGLRPALKQISSFTDDHTLILPCLNGITSESISRESYADDQVIRCIVQGMDATYLQNEVTFSTTGEIIIGSENERQKKSVDILKQFFDECHVPCRISRDIIKDQWNKLMLNCGINQVCAAHQCGYGQCSDNGPYQEEFVQAMKEVKEVANAFDIELTDQDIRQWIRLVNGLGSRQMPSMAQDIIKHQKTELALFSGTILPLAKEKRIEVPVLTHLYEQITKLEDSFV